MAGRRAPPDFIAVELEFLYTLSHREAERGRRARQPKPVAWARPRERFLDEHAQRWLPAFAGAVRAESRHPFYIALGGLLGCFLAAWRPAGAAAESAATRGGPAG